MAEGTATSNSTTHTRTPGRLERKYDALDSSLDQADLHLPINDNDNSVSNEGNEVNEVNESAATLESSAKKQKIGDIGNIGNYASNDNNQVFWFVLVNSKGNPVGGKRKVQNVVLAAGTTDNVGNVQRAIKLENSGKLVNVDASDLEIFPNGAVFEASNSEPLEIHDSVSGKGVSHEDPMLVVVPPSSSNFDLNLSKMFSKNANAEIVNLGPELAYLVYGVDQIFVRKAYTELFQLIYNEGNPPKQKVLVTGTPGVGKTLFLIYCAFTLVTEHNKTVFLVTMNAEHKFIISPDGAQKFLASSSQRPEGNDWFYLVDGTSPIIYPCTLTILTLSPRLEGANQYVKSGINKFYMPLWEWTEIEKVKWLLALSIDLAVLKARFQILDGVPRRLFDTTESAEAIVKYGLNNTRADDLLSAEETGFNLAVRHALVLHHASENYTTFLPRYASRYVAVQAYEKLKTHGLIQMKHFVMSSGHYSHIAGLRGQLYEHLAHKSLGKGGTFKRRSLKKSKHEGSKAVDVVIPGSAIVVDRFSNLEDAYARASDCRASGSLGNENARAKKARYSGIYFLPGYGFEAVDGWIQNECIFQMTVGKKHDLKPMIHEVSAKCNSNILYFVVPDSETFDRFTYVNPKPPRGSVKPVTFIEFVLLVPPFDGTETA